MTLMVERQLVLYIISSCQIFVSIPTENCSHDFTEKRPTGQVSCILSALGGNDSREGKGEKKQREERRKINGCTLVFYFGYFREKKTTEPILAVIMLSKIQLDI